MERYRRSTKDNDTDQHVLTIFLPLLAIAILACIGGCCYMERRRRRRKKKHGGIDPEELRHQQDNDDAMSVISSSSSKRRHYLEPTPTTGRTVRGTRVRSSYSRFGEPLYDREKRRRSSIGGQSHHSDWNGMLIEHQQERPSSRHSNGYGGRPLSRARSMTDIRVGADADRTSLRRSRSSSSFGRMSSDVADSGYNDNQSNSETENTYEFLNLKPEKDAISNSQSFRYNRQASPTQSAYSIRTAPSWTGQDYRTNNTRSQSTSRPATNREFSAYNDRPIPRSMSQPDLSRLVDSKTYPQGILKKDTTSDVRNRRSTGSHYNYSGNQGDTHAGNEYTAHYPRSGRLQNSSEDQSNARASSRPSSALSYRPQSYDPYYTGRYGDYGVYGSYGHAPAYSTSGYHRHHQLPGKYAGGYDQYGNYNDYWGNYSHNHRMSMY